MPPGLKLVDGAWWVDCYIHGKRKRRKCPSKSLAIQLHRKWKEEERRARLFPEEAAARARLITVAQLVHRYAEESRNNNANWRKMALYGQYWIDFLGDRVVQSLRTEDVERYKAARLAMGRAPSTINKEVKRLKTLMNQALRDGLLSLNPIALVRTIPGELKRLRWLSEVEEVRLWFAMSPRDWWFVEFAFRTGLRQSEQFFLKREHINLEAKVIHVVKTKNRERRELPINARLAGKLERWLGDHDSDWVFPSPRGGMPHPTNFYHRQFEPALLKARIENLVWHDLRHTFGSRLAQRGVPLQVIQELMGHKSIQQTQRYAHLAPTQARAAVDLV